MASLIIATWNANGLSNRQQEVDVLMKMHHLDILLISESRLTESSRTDISGYHTYLTAHPDDTGHAGTAIIVRNNIKHQLLPKYRTAQIQYVYKVVT